MSKINLPELPNSPGSIYFEGEGLEPGELVDMYSGIQMRAYAEQAVRQALAAQNPVAWRYWNEKSKSWNVTTSAVVADAMREFGRIVESLCAPPQASADKDPPCSLTSDSGHPT